VVQREATDFLRFLDGVNCPGIGGGRFVLGSLTAG